MTTQEALAQAGCSLAARPQHGQEAGGRSAILLVLQLRRAKAVRRDTPACQCQYKPPAGQDSDRQGEALPSLQCMATPGKARPGHRDTTHVRHMTRDVAVAAPVAAPYNNRARTKDKGRALSSAVEPEQLAS